MSREQEKTELDITGQHKTINDLLSRSKYTIDYYQREYKWQSKNITELLADLEDKFDDYYRPEHERDAIDSYGAYFLGSIVLSRKNRQNFIIDGQQRLTSLTLLLIYLNNLQKEQGGDQVELKDLIFSERRGKKSFNLDIPERTAAMEALYNGEAYPVNDEMEESVQNILARYDDIVENFPDALKGHALPYFIEWLQDRVFLVEITAYSDEDAYIIFETMNDRGLSLSPTDMLKGYLLSNISDDAARGKAHALWRDKILELLAIGKEDEIDFFKTWLRSQYADTIRERKKGSKNQDWERIGTTFHKWVREEAERVGLSNSDAYASFITRDMAFYGRQYIRLREAATSTTPGLETVRYLHHINFTLQYPLLLAPLRPDDSPDMIDEKLRLVGSALDIYVARRIWNFRTLGYSALVYGFFNLMTDIRGLSVADLSQHLSQWVAKLDYDFRTQAYLRMHQQNRRYIHYLLARITHHIETQSGIDSTFDQYVIRQKKTKPYEVEHIWANHLNRHSDEYDNEHDFQQVRNRIGGLLLLQRGVNQAFSDKPYADKVPHYHRQNLLAQSLYHQTYQLNPSFKQYINRSGLPFQPYAQFNTDELMARQQLYTAICEELWSPNRLKSQL